MKLSIKINLNPSPEQHALLKETMKLFNQTCNTISQTAFHNQTFGKWPIQKLIYHDLKKTSGIPAQLGSKAISGAGLVSATESGFRRDSYMGSMKSLQCIPEAISVGIRSGLPASYKTPARF